MSNKDAEEGSWGLRAEVTGKHEDAHPARAGGGGSEHGCCYVTSSTSACDYIWGAGFQGVIKLQGGH